MIPKLISFRALTELLCRVVSTYLYPYKDDVLRFDFQVDKNDESMVGVLATFAGRASF